MRRSICYCEPNIALAGASSQWKFIYTTSQTLPKGTCVKFDLLSEGRPSDWEVPKFSDKEKNPPIWIKTPNGKIATATVLTDSLSAFEFVLPEEIPSGEIFTIHMGTDKQGNIAQKNIQRRRPFHILIDPKGKKEYKDPEVFHMDIRGNVLHKMRIVAPSVVMRNKRFDVIVRFEDEFGNLTNNSPEGTLIDLSYQHLRENLNWKLFVPETGFITLPNLYFNEPGIYKIQLKNLHTKQTFFSPPIKCFAATDTSLFWGTFHGESTRFDATENIEMCLRHFRDEKGFQFYSTSPFESTEEISSDEWKLIGQQVATFNEDERFTAFLGMQWEGEKKIEGTRQFLFSKDNRPLLRRKELKANSLKKIYHTYQAKELLSIPTFTMGKASSFDFEDFHPDFEKVVEIYNAWGSSECSEKEGNLRPIQKNGKTEEEKEGSIQKALLNNCRFGFVAGGLDDRGIYQNFYEENYTQYTPGLTAIFAKDQTRSSLWEALHKKACYATTGARILLGCEIAGEPIGSELSTASKPGLEFNRHITGYAVGTAPIEKIELLRNGKLLQTFTSDKDDLEFTFDDSENLKKIALSAKGENPPFIFYYIRVFQKDGHLAWSSPIWVDYEALSSSPVKKTKKR